MKSVEKGISSFAWESLNSNSAQTGRAGSRKRRLQISFLQPDIDSIDSSDSCHSDTSDVINNKRSCPTISHHFMPTPYSKALAESISEFEASSESGDDGCHGDVDDVKCKHSICDDTKGSGSHGNISEHQHDISDSESIGSVASSSDVCTANQVTTSDWLKGVTMTTPDSKVTTPMKGGSSSGRWSKAPRRRITFIKCGLAEQLDRLLSQQRSEKTLWHHQMLRQDNHAVPGGSLVVRVINLVTSHSLFVVQAHVIQEAELGRPHKGELVTILFNDDTMKVLKLQPGSAVFICPPWQSITVKRSHLVLLSTHFCLPFSYDKDDHHHDSITDTVTSVTTDHLGIKSLSTTTAFKENDHETCVLMHDKEELHCDQPYDERAPQDDIDERKFTSLLEAMEQARYGHVAMAAKICRVYQYKVSCRVAKQFSSGSLMDDFIQSAKNYHQDGSSIRWCFLMKDNQGVWSEVMVDNEQVICSREWRNLVSHGEGKQCHFTKLRVVARTTRTTNPNTFSLISSILEEEEEEPTSKVTVTFCYQLFATATATVQQIESEDAVPPSYHVMMQDLAQAHPIRMTLFGQVIHHVAEDKLLLATTSSNKILMAIIKPGCVLDNRLATANGSYLFIRDAANIPGDAVIVCCDGCTLLIPTDRRGNPLNNKLRPRISCDVGELQQPCVLQLTKANCNVGSLVYTKGTVVAVDEDNATYLPLCDACGEHLKESKENSDEFYCVRCHVTVRNPAIAIELAVYMVSAGLPQYTLHVQLHKTTTSKLLPIDYSTAEEGLDVNQVLNQTLQISTGYISAIDDTMVHMQEIELNKPAQ